MRIARKLRIVPAGLSGLTALLGIMACIALLDTQNRSDAAIDRAFALGPERTTLDYHATTFLEEARQLARMTDPAQIKLQLTSLETLQTRLYRDLRLMGLLDTAPELKTSLAEVDRLIHAARPTLDTDAIAQTSALTAESDWIGSLVRAATDVEQQTVALVSARRADLSQLKDQLHQHAQNWVLGLASFAVLGLMVGLGYFFAVVERGIVSRLGTLQMRARDLAAEQTDRMPSLSGHDEISSVDSALDQLNEFTRSRLELEENLNEARLHAEGNARAKSEFLALMSHEVRTPLNAIIGMFELIARSNIPERQRKRARNGRLAAEQLFGMLSKILDASRLEANGIEATAGPVLIRELVHHAQDTASAAIVKYASQVSLSIHAEGVDHLAIRTDDLLVRQIVGNLIDNAVRFTQEGEIEITFSCDEPSDSLRICVSDSGIGIPPEHVDLIFEPFRQVDSSMGRKKGGSGLGLSISRGLATLLKGELEYMPRSTRGSSFILSLPFKAFPGDPRDENLVG